MLLFFSLSPSFFPGKVLTAGSRGQRVSISATFLGLQKEILDQQLDRSQGMMAIHILDLGDYAFCLNNRYYLKGLDRKETQRHCLK